MQIAIKREVTMFKKNVFLFMGCVLFFAFVDISFANGFDFRKTRWGMSVDEVIKSEKAEPVDREDKDGGEMKLDFSTRFLGENFTVKYTFFDGHLFGGEYVTLRENYLSECEKFYEKMVEVLSVKYGKGYKNNDMRDALSVFRTSEWKKARTAISVSLLSLKGSPNCLISIKYESSDYKKMAEKAEKKRQGKLKESAKDLIQDDLI